MNTYGFSIINQRGESEYVLFTANDIYIASKEFRKKYKPRMVKKIIRVR